MPGGELIITSMCKGKDPSLKINVVKSALDAFTSPNESRADLTPNVLSGSLILRATSYSFLPAKKRDTARTSIQRLYPVASLCQWE